MYRRTLETAKTTVVNTERENRSNSHDSHTFKFDRADKEFEIMDKKLDGVIKPIIKFQENHFCANQILSLGFNPAI